MAQAQFYEKFKHLHSDNGIEFIGLKSYLLEEGILH